MKDHIKLSTATRLKAILDGTGAGTWEWNLDTGDVVFNDRWASMLGYTLAELGPLSIKVWQELCHPEDLPATHQALLAYIEGSASRYECIVRMQHKDGQWRYIQTRGMLLSDDSDSAPRWLMGTHLDVTEEKASQHQLKRLAESLPGIIYTFVMEPDGSYRFPFLSPKTEQFYGVSAEAAMANAGLLFEVIHPDDSPRVQESILTSARSMTEWVCDYRILRDGQSQWVRGTSQPERGSDGSVVWHGVTTNIDDQKRLELKLEALSMTDELTGLYNLRYLLMRLEACAAEAQRYDRPFALMTIDIDFFKDVNDSWGHPTGDAVLKGIAELFRQRTRRADIIARTGGEEFVVLMPNTELDGAAQVAESLRSALEQQTFTSDGGECFRVTLSAGIASWSAHTNSVRSLMSSCDRLLYAAKKAGRNRVVAAGHLNQRT